MMPITKPDQGPVWLPFFLGGAPPETASQPTARAPTAPLLLAQCLLQVPQLFRLRRLQTNVQQSSTQTLTVVTHQVQRQLLHLHTACRKLRTVRVPQVVPLFLRHQTLPRRGRTGLLGVNGPPPHVVF